MARPLRHAALAFVIAAGAAHALAPAGGDRVATLSADLRAAMTKAEEHATASNFPRKNILAAVSAAMWKTFYKGDYTSDEESRAVDRVATEAPTPITQEAANRMKYELKLD